MTKKLIIGDKMRFAIEYEIQKGGRYVMGRLRLWLSGQYIGAYDDIAMLSAILFQMEGVEITKLEGCEFLKETANRIYDLIESNVAFDSRRHLLMLGESFDDFSIYWFYCKGNLHFVWKLTDSPVFAYPDYPKGVQYAQISVEEFIMVVSELRKVINLAKGLAG